MTNLFLIRHGLTAQTGKTLYGQTPGIPLDDRGRAQAEALVERFHGIRIIALYSSPLERCTQTIEPLAASRGLDIVLRDDLIEMDAGTWTNRPLAQVRRTKAWRTLIESPTGFRFPDGESFLEAQARTVDALSDVVSRHRRGNVVIATHGDIVRILVSHFGGAHLDHFQRTIVDTGAVSVIHVDAGMPRVLLVNDTGGLGRFAPRRKARNPAPRKDRNLRG